MLLMNLLILLKVFLFFHVWPKLLQAFRDFFSREQLSKRCVSPPRLGQLDDVKTAPFRRAYGWLAGEFGGKVAEE